MGQERISRARWAVTPGSRNNGAVDLEPLQSGSPLDAVAGEGPDVGDLDGSEPPRGWLPWWQALVIALAVGVLGMAVGKLISRPDHPGPDSVDVGFLQDMRLHHDQAVSMSFIYIAKPTDGTDVNLRTIAREIIRGQQLENGLMVQILRDWRQVEQNETETTMGWMGMAIAADEMPGLASAADMDKLTAATGNEASRLFATLMIAHHEGGIHMAEYAQTHASTKDVRQLAAAMIGAQRSDLVELRQLLAKVEAA
jgi:uncharacterized protein (DUF305 family)